jgi:hypothetical protein
MREYLGDRAYAMADECGRLLLERAKKAVSGRKVVAIAALAMLRRALDDLSPDERSAMFDHVVAELRREP